MIVHRTAQGSRMLQSAQTDHDRLVAALRQLAPCVQKSADRAWSRQPALRVIDCVLSLNRNYDRFVVPRLDRFERTRPEVCSVSKLRDEIACHSSAYEFVVNALTYNDKSRAATLAAVVDWLVTVSGDGPCATQLANLEDWAKKAHHNDHTALGIRGFGVAGFQYLRMLFGANTTKPDIHIRRFVQSRIGHAVSPVQALELLEHAAPEAGIYLRDADTSIWESSARAHASNHGAACGAY